MARFFKFAELVATSTGLPNIPDWDAIENLKTLAAFLDKIRIAFGKPIRVNCAYRSEAVNAKVGGVKTSAHLKGLAADVCAYSGKEEDNRSLVKVIERNMTHIDQAISYHKVAGNSSSPIRFIHIGLCEGVPRMQRLYK